MNGRLWIPEQEKAKRNSSASNANKLEAAATILYKFQSIQFHSILMVYITNGNMHILHFRLFSFYSVRDEGIFMQIYYGFHIEEAQLLLIFAAL